ncbi:Putative lumazine-binding [Formosa sp. Hel1_31_208]|uniref:nuclear transport factor 2 family protein n=1 Tax=Formosa sp. Hel1_31_208 TaxID=1798225 RepID=UPI00087CF4C7|nr:nuclear transport factor 2 family protein [Formosa sp. Hel1_31_208]SDS61446.1 Putative lumazine-binding [Formosa sp. Hel1_31_208]
MRTITLLLLFITSSSMVFAQNNNDIELISSTIENYYEGYIERDINKLNKAFDTVHGTMKVPVVENGKITAYENRYFKELMPKWGNREKLSAVALQNCALTILNIDIEDETIASAKMSMKVDKVTYIDILSLQKIDDQWKITNKIFSVDNQ